MSTANSPPGTGRSSACWPIHDTIRSAVTRCSNTTSGGAPISIEVEKSAIGLLWNGAPPGFSLTRLLERPEVRRPEPVEELADRCQPIGANDEQVTGPVALLAHQPSVPKPPEVMQGDLLRDAELLRDLAHGSGLVTNQLENAPAVAGRKRSQRPVDRLRLPHHRSYSNRALYKCQFDRAEIRSAYRMG